MAKRRKKKAGVPEKVPQPKQRKVAILGTCLSRTEAPVNDLDWEIWTIGPGGKNVQRWDRLFEVHGPDTWPPGFREYLEELKSVQPPRMIFTEAPMPDWPAGKVIPKDHYFQKYGRMWFQSQISYALAMAIDEGVQTIGIYGIDLEAGEEYRSQFTGARFFIDVARLAGITIILPEGCGLTRDPNPYPDAWETHLAMTMKSKIAFLEGMHSSKSAAFKQMEAELIGLQGELNAYKFIQSLYVISGVDPMTPTANPEETLSEKVERIDLMMRGIVDGQGNILTRDPVLDQAVAALPENHE